MQEYVNTMLSERTRNMAKRYERSFGKLPELLMHDTKISLGAKVLYAHMHWRYGSNKKNFESQEKMAQYLGVSRQTIRSWLTELEREGWIVILPPGKPEGGHYKTNTYHVFDHPEDCRRWRETRGNSALHYMSS